MSRVLRLIPILIGVGCVVADVAAQSTVDVATVISKTVERQVKLPGELQPFLAVPVFAKVSGFVKEMAVDRGSMVKEGQLLASLEAPELQAQLAESEAKAEQVQTEQVEAEAKLAGVQSTYDHLKAASATPGVVAENDVVVAGKNVDAARALVKSYESSLNAARAQVVVARDLEQYLQIRAPFDGVITERMVHPGALVGPGSTPLLQLHQISRLRLVVAVPEALVGAIVQGAHVPFTVPSYPAEEFQGTVSRVAHDLDPRTRTMAVELDVRNADLRLGAGMYPEVRWPIRRPQPSLLVPATSIVTTTERTFVITVSDGIAHWADVKAGARVGDTVEVFGPLKEGTVIVRRGTDEIHDGDKVTIRSAVVR